MEAKCLSSSAAGVAHFSWRLFERLHIQSASHTHLRTRVAVRHFTCMEKGRSYQCDISPLNVPGKKVVSRHDRSYTR